MDIKKIVPFIASSLFLTPLVFSPFGVQIFEMPQQIFLVVVLSLLLILSALIFFREKWSFFYEKRIFLLVSLVFISLLTSAVLSISPVESFFGSFERGQGLFIQFFYLVLFVALLQFLQKKARREKLLMVIIGVGTALSAIALLQMIGLDLTGINNLAQTSGRPFATLGQPNFLGQWLIVPILGIHFILIQKKAIKKNRKYLLWMLLLVNYIGLILTQNKATFLALAVALVFLFFYKKFRKIYLVLAVTLVVLLGILLLGSSRSLSSRLMTWGSAIGPILEQPVFGHGQETYYLTAQHSLDPKVFRYEDPYTMPDRIHNFVLQTLHDYGLVGFLTLIFIAAFIIISFRKNPNDENYFSLLALVTFSVSLFFSFSLTSNMVVFCYILALFTVTTFSFKKITVSNSGLKILFLVMTLLFTGTMVFHQFRTFSANIYLAKGLENFFRDQAAAKQEFYKIISLNPPFRYLHYSVIHLLSFQYSPEMEQSLTSLGNITNKNFYYFIASARIHKAKGELPAAYADLEKAAELAPNFVLIYQLHGQFAYEAANYTRAIRQLEKVLQIVPPFWRKDHAVDFASAEQSRIFLKNHPEFSEVLGMLVRSYNQTGQQNRAQAILDSVSH